MKVSIALPYKSTVHVDSGEYLNNRKKYDGSSWMDPCPIDIYGGYVPTDKYAKDNLKKTQENIKERFDLDDDEGGDY